jgi:hypothetical protein
MQSVSASGALISTEVGIGPSAVMVVEMLAPQLGMAQRELPACVIRAGHGELAVEWTELASSAVSAVLTEAMLASGVGEAAAPPALGRVPFCALAPGATR